MPLILIDTSPPAPSQSIAGMISTLREEGARALNCSPDNIWVMCRFLDRNFNGTFPPVITVKAQSGRTLGQKESFVRAVTKVVATTFAISPDKVWIHYQEMNPQDIWFDGRWLSNA